VGILTYSYFLWNDHWILCKTFIFGCALFAYGFSSGNPGNIAAKLKDFILKSITQGIDFFPKRKVGFRLFGWSWVDATSFST